LIGIGAGTALAGCLSETTSDGDNGDGTETDDGSPTTPDVEAIDATPLSIRSSRPSWLRPEAARVILIDGVEREAAVLGLFDLSGERREAVREFVSGIEYDSDRLLLVEAVAPDACHDRVELESIRIADDELRADAAVVDSSDGATSCAEVITYPSALARLGFEGEPLDTATVEVTNGWDDTEMVTADASDPIGPDIDSLAGAVRPGGDAEPRSPLECDEAGVQRHSQMFEEPELSWGKTVQDGKPALALRIDEITHARGDTATIRLTNVSDGLVETGNRAKYNFQAHAESGWQDVRVGDADRPFEYTDEAIAHPPGEAFEWRFELTELGLVDGAFHDQAEVCPDLQVGRYRFVYWGAIGSAVAVAFDLER
jgi:hypothetical protein